MKSPFKEDHAMVFMGGFASGTTVEELKQKLKQSDIKMIRCSVIYYPYYYGWSFVTLSTSEEAIHLIKHSPIILKNRNIDIRPFMNHKRVRNDINYCPKDDELLQLMISILYHKKEGLSVTQIQTKIF